MAWSRRSSPTAPRRLADERGRAQSRGCRLTGEAHTPSLGVGWRAPRPPSDRTNMGTDWSVSHERGEALRFDIERDLLCTVDADGYFTSLNAGWERILGWTREELMSRPLIDFVHSADRERTLEESSKVSRPDYQVVDFENRYRAKGGGWRWLRWSARSDGTTWFAVAYDVTETKESERRLRRVLTAEHLVAYSQPIVERLGSRAVQEELLVRMRVPHEDGRILSPSQFLPDAERYGFIDLIDRWMVSQGVALAVRGRRTEVNLSARSIGDARFAADLEDAVREAGPSAENLILEITETAALENLDAALEFAERLTRLGCRFVHDEEDHGLVKGIVAIARELGVLTVAEGVEDEATLWLLRETGVDYLQGYLIGRPAPLA